MEARSLSPLLVGILSLSGLLSLSSCKEGTADLSSPTAVRVSATDLSKLPLATNMLRGGDPLPEPAPVGVPGAGGAITPSVKEGVKGVIISRSTMYSAGMVYNEYLLFNPMSSLIYPGNVLVGNSISNGRYLPVMGQKIGAVTWSTPDLVPDGLQGKKFVATIEEPRFSDYSSTIQEWRSLPQRTGSAITTLEWTEVKDFREFSAKLGLGVDVEKVKLGLDFDSKRGHMKTHVLIKFVQKLFSVSMDTPGRPHLLEAAPGALGGVMPVYISDVFYGRMAYALISSDHDCLELMAALRIMSPGGTASLELSSKYKQTLDESFSQYILVGGQADKHGLAVRDGWEGFKEAISSAPSSADAVPVAITLRYADDNSVARVVQTGQYPVTESYFVREGEEMIFTLRPVQIKASAGRKSDIQVYGSATVTVPADLTPEGKGSVEYSLISIDKGQYLKMDEQKQADLPNGESTTITLHRPKGMSMSDFLNQRLYFGATLHNTNPAGKITGDNLGQTKFSIRIQDLLFHAIHNSFTISTRGNYRNDYSATISFDLFHDAKEIDEIPTSLRTVTGADGLSSETRCFGSQPLSTYIL